MQAILMNSFCIGIVYTRLSRAIVVVLFASQLDPLSLTDLLRQGDHQADRWPVVPRVPGLRAAQAPAGGEPCKLLLCAEDGERGERSALPDDTHATHRRAVR